MSKICPKCGNPPSDERLLACDVCKVLFIEESRQHSNLTEAQLRNVANHILKSVRFWIFLCIGVIAIVWVVLGAIDYFTGRKIQTVIDQIESRTSNSLNQAEITMSNTITHKFEEPRIQIIVAQAAEGQASNIIAQQVEPTVQQFKSDIEKQRMIVEQTKERVLGMEADIKAAYDLAQPAALVGKAMEVKPEPDGLKALIQFERTKVAYLGTMDFKIKVIRPDDVKILALSPVNQPRTAAPASINPDGKEASVSFTILGAEDYPMLEVKLSGEALLQITGNKIKQPISALIQKPH